MDQPQSQVEVGPVVQALKRLDHRLDIIWNPRARIIQSARFDVHGRSLPAQYDGRWEVVIRETDIGLHKDRDYSVIYQVREPITDAYKPVGMWLVEFMQKWDSQQSHFRALMDKAWAEHEKADEDAGIDDAAIRDQVDRIHFAGNYAGGQGNWMGKGADFASMAKAAMSPPNGQTAT